MRFDDGQPHDKDPPYIDESLVINTRLGEVERQQREDKEADRKHNLSQLRTNKSIAIFTGLLFVTSVASDVMLYRQIRVANQSADAAKTAADAASDQVRLMRQQLQSQNATLRLRITTRRDTNLNEGVGRTAEVSTINIGQTPARDISVSALVKLRALDGADIRSLRIIEFTLPRLESAYVTPMGFPRASMSAGDTDTRHFSYSLQAVESARFNKGSAVVVYDGVATYRTQFSESVAKEPFCFVAPVSWQTNTDGTIAPTQDIDNLPCVEFESRLPQIRRFIEQAAAH